MLTGILKKNKLLVRINWRKLSLLWVQEHEERATSSANYKTKNKRMISIPADQQVLMNRKLVISSFYHDNIFDVSPVMRGYHANVNQLYQVTSSGKKSNGTALIS